MAATPIERALRDHIASLKDEVAFLRAQLAGGTPAPVNMNDLPMTSQLWTSEEEEEAKDLLESGIIDKDDYESMMQATGALSTDIEIAPIR